MKTIFQAKRLPQHVGPAAWNAILPAQPPARVLDGDVTADFAIIGGGFAGLSAARRLVQLNPGARIVLLDAGRIAEGASGRNSGFMIDLPHELTSSDYAGSQMDSDRRLINLNREAIQFAREAVSEYAIDSAFFDPVGKVNGAASPGGDAQNKSYAKHLDQLNEPYELLDAQAMTELTGSRYYLSGLYTPGTAMIQPAGYTRGLAAGLAREAKVYENSPVTGFKRVGPDWELTTPKGKVTTHKIIMACNGHLESFGFLRWRFMHVFLHAAMTPELNAEQLKQLAGQPRWGVTPSDPMGTTMRKIDTAQGGHRIITRTCASFHPGMKTSERQLARAAHVMQRKFEDRFPQFAGMRMEYTWSGHLCLSRNNVSVMKELETGLFTACCQNGLGAARGTLTGMGAAELASGQTSDITDYFGPQPVPNLLPPPPISTLGANLVLRWKEWQARRE